MAELVGTALEKTHTEILLRTVPLGESAQADDSEQDDMWTPEASIRPPEDLDALSAMSEGSWVRSSAIEAIGRNTVGLGFTLEPAFGHENEVDKTTQMEAAHTFDVLAQRDKRLNPSSFADLLFAVKTDEEECGNGAMEVSRDRKTGMIDGLFHAPGKRVRRLKDRSGYIIGRSKAFAQVESDAERYYNFGDKVKYDGEGKATATLRPGRRWDRNELLTFRLYSSESRDYGMPRDVEMAISYWAIRNLDRWNAAFFGSSGALPALLFVQGVETRDGTRISYRVPQETIDRIQQSLRGGAGTAERVAIVPLPPEAKVQMETLGHVSERDITFENYRTAHERDVLGAFRLGPIFVAMEGEGRYTAEVQRALALEQVFDPEQRRYERTLNNTLCPDIGIPDLAFKFKRLAVESDAARRDSADALAEANAITMGEYRDAHGFPPLSEKEFGKGVNEQFVTKQPNLPQHTAVPASQDQRGLTPGLAGRRSKRGTTARAPAGIAKQNGGHDHADMPEYVEEAVSDLQGELAGD